MMDQCSVSAKHPAGRVLQIRICALPRSMVDEETRQGEYQRFLYFVHHLERTPLLRLLANPGSRNGHDSRYRRTHHVPICRSKDKIYPPDPVVMTYISISSRKHRRYGKWQIRLYTEEIHLLRQFKRRPASETDLMAESAGIVSNRMMMIAG